MAFVVGLVVDMLVVVGEYRLVGFGPVLDTVSCEDPHNMMCSVHLVMDLLLNEIE